MRNAEYIRAEALSYVTQPFRADIRIPHSEFGKKGGEGFLS